VDELVAKYEFNEELLFQRLHLKYNALAAGDQSHSVMKNIDESEFLYEEGEEERVASDDETAGWLEEEKETAAPAKRAKDTPVAENQKSPLPFAPERNSGSSGSDDSYELVEKKAMSVAVATCRPLELEVEDYDLLDGTPPVSPHTAERLAYTHRQSSELIKDAIAVARRVQQERIERRIANIASRSGDGYAGH